MTVNGTRDRIVNTDPSGGGGGGGGPVTQATTPWVVDDPDTQSALATILAELSLILTQLQGELEVKNDAGNPLAISGTVSVTEPVSVDDNGSSLTVDGTVAVSNFPASQPVSGTVEVTNDVGNPLPISGTVTANLGTIDGAATEVTLLDVDDTLASKLDPVTPFTSIETTSGNNLLLTPALGQRLQLRWLWAQAKATNAQTVIATFNSSVLGDIYVASLEASQPFAHSAVIDLATNETLSVDLDVSQAVIINIDYREVT